MISKADILEGAREWQLTTEVVEKDYVLGWLLAFVRLSKTNICRFDSFPGMEIAML